MELTKPMIPSRETKENRQHSTPLIPYSFYNVNIPESLNNVPMHWHSEFELNRILHGAGEFICGDKRFTAKEGDFLLIPPNMLHSAHPLENQKLIYQALVFHSAMVGANNNDRCTIECVRPMINGTMQRSNVICPSTEKYKEIKNTVDCIFSCAFGNLPQLDLLLKSELLRLLWLLDQTELSDYHNTSSISYTEIIRPALEYMMENLQENISIDQLASVSHLSKSYFMNCFKKAVGIGAIEHLTHLRINAACDALSNTGKQISEIAFSCGYSNLSNFNRQFKQIMGCSPKEYRKKKTN
jgi:AraC-like DNA-binding protein/mannose-6-phosphate isomerase-like protein (cupin superfamily)